jgi:hypothetical protein
MKSYGFALTCFLMAGCATQPLSNVASKPVPAERILDWRFLKAQAGTGVVTVKRDAGAGGSACSTRVFINAKPVADIRTEEKVVLYLPANNYIIGAIANGICAGGLTEVQATVTPGSEATFRIGYGSNSEFFINATAF